MQEYQRQRRILIGALFAFSTVTVASAADRMIVMTFATLSPDRSLPVLKNIPPAMLQPDTVGLRDSVSLKGATEPVVSEGGWKSDVLPNPSVGSFDEYRMEISTNDSNRASSEAGALFEAIGFLPIDEYSDTARHGIVSTNVSFFGNLAFVYGGPMPIVVLERSQADRSYRYKSSAPSTIGRVAQHTLGDLPVYFFEQDVERTRAEMRRKYPVCRALVVWDYLGRLSFQASYDELVWEDYQLLVIRNTRSLSAPCGRSSSSFNCRTSGNTCQLSLLDPLSGEPVILREEFRIAYERGELNPTHADLQLVSARDFEGDAVSCRSFSTREQILSEGEYGVCGMNIDGVGIWRCLGTAEGYLRESTEASLRYWLLLSRSIADLPRDIIGVDSAVERLLDRLPANNQPEMVAPDPPRSFGCRDSFGFAAISWASKSRH